MVGQEAPPLCFVQVFSYTADKEIRTDDLCLDVSRLNGPVVMLKCHHMKGNQMFEYDTEVSAVWLVLDHILHRYESTYVTKPLTHQNVRGNTLSGHQMVPHVSDCVFCVYSWHCMLNWARLFLL